MQSGAAALLGREVGGWRLERVLGTGGSGAVYLGRASGSGSPVAVKVLLPPWQTTAEDRALFRARFLREIEIVQLLLRHPGIVPVLSAGEQESLVYLVLPFEPGGTLASRVAHCGDEQALEWLGQVAAALDYAHAQGVVHRDLKPANVLLDGQDRALLADFGILRLVAFHQTTLTATGQVVGTPAYMAPEQASGQDVGPAADLYSLGVMAYELLIKRLPFTAPTPMELMLAHLQQPPPLPRRLRPDLPAPAEAVLLAMLAKRPAERYPSAAAFVAALRAGMMGTPTDLPAITTAQRATVQAPPTPPTIPAGAGATLGAGTPPMPAAPGSGYTPTIPATPGLPGSDARPRRRATWRGLAAALALVVVLASGGALYVTRQGGGHRTTGTLGTGATATPTSALGGTVTAGTPVSAATATPHPLATATATPVGLPKPTSTPPAPTATPTPFTFAPGTAVFAQTLSGFYGFNAGTGAVGYMNFNLGGSGGIALANGVIYGANGNTLVAVSAGTGNILWQTAAYPDSFADTPAVANGVVFAGTTKTLYAVRASNGQQLWSYTTGNQLTDSPGVANNLVVFGDMSGTVYAVNAGSGSLVWKTYTNNANAVFCTPTIVNNVIYIGSAGDPFDALNLNTGSLLWSFQGDGYGDYSTQALDVNGVLYFGGLNDYFYAVQASNGTELWKFQTPHFQGARAAYANGVVYFPTYVDGRIYALNAGTGRQQWVYQAAGPVESAPVVVNGTLAIGSDAQTFYALNASNGAVQWTQAINNNVASAVLFGP